MAAAKAARAKLTTTEVVATVSTSKGGGVAMMKSGRGGSRSESDRPGSEVGLDPGCKRARSVARLAGPAGSHWAVLEALGQPGSEL
jgi:hypothetical protein